MLLAAAVVFAVPSALIMGELSTGFPYDGGIIQWVEEVQWCFKTNNSLHLHFLWSLCKESRFDGSKQLPNIPLSAAKVELP